MDIISIQIKEMYWLQDITLSVIGVNARNM